MDSLAVQADITVTLSSAVNLSRHPEARVHILAKRRRLASLIVPGIVNSTLRRTVGSSVARLTCADRREAGVTIDQTSALGAFFIAMIPARRWLASRDLKLRLWHLSVVGLVVGYLTGIVVSTGPLTVPIFLSYGLVKGAFLATEAASSLAVYISKAVVFRTLGALPADIIVEGLITGSSLMAGAFLAKRFVLKLEPERFRLVMDGLMLVSGATMLLTAVN